VGGEGEGRWLAEPPLGVSASEWADAYETIKDLIVEFVDEYGNANIEDRMAVFALEDALQRCALEAESREPGILDRREQDNIDGLRGGFEEFMP
jgi:hypothetical protein